MPQYGYLSIHCLQNPQSSNRNSYKEDMNRLEDNSLINYPRGTQHINIEWTKLAEDIIVVK